jgi:hypothetical protein
MRRTALPSLSILFAGLLSGCTGTGVFFDHTSQWFGGNPNTPAGSSETFARIRGQKVDVPPLLPEPGNVWPTDTGPDRTLQDLEKDQAEAIRRAGGATPATGPNPATNRANGADRGLPPPQPAPGMPGDLSVPTTNTPNGPSLGTAGRGTGRGYRQLNTPNTGGSGILVPNGNGTSTLIGPDGSVQTVPSRP